MISSLVKDTCSPELKKKEHASEKENKDFCHWTPSSFPLYVTICTAKWQILKIVWKEKKDTLKHIKQAFLVFQESMY